MNHAVTITSIRRHHAEGTPPTSAEVAFLLGRLETVEGERDVHRKRAWTAEKRAETAERRLSSAGVQVNAVGAIKNDAPGRSVAQLSRVEGLEAENNELRKRVADLERVVRVRIGVVEIEQIRDRHRELNPGRERF